jgi:hypothetical protein
MKQEVCLLPVRCRGCSTVFDLWHDLQLEQENLESVRSGDFRRLVNQSFCWHCRLLLSGDSEQEEPEANEEPSEEIQSELSLSLFYEV